MQEQQRQKLLEVDKRELTFWVRGNQVERDKIERWMKANNVPDDALYECCVTQGTFLEITGRMSISLIRLETASAISYRRASEADPTVLNQQIVYSPSEATPSSSGPSSIVTPIEQPVQANGLSSTLFPPCATCASRELYHRIVHPADSFATDLSLVTLSIDFHSSTNVLALSHLGYSNLLSMPVPCTTSQSAVCWDKVSVFELCRSVCGHVAVADRRYAEEDFSREIGEAISVSQASRVDYQGKQRLQWKNLTPHLTLTMLRTQGRGEDLPASLLINIFGGEQRFCFPTKKDDVQWLVSVLAVRVAEDYFIYTKLLRHQMIREVACFDYEADPFFANILYDGP